MDANPIGVVIIAVGLLATAFVYAYNNIKPFRDFINGLWSDLIGLVNFITSNKHYWDQAAQDTKNSTGIARNAGGPFGGASGAIVTRPTWTLIGEGGPEAVVPLNQSPGNSALPGMSDDRIVEWLQNIHAALKERPAFGTTAYGRT